MPTIVGILTFMSRINFVLSWVEYELFITTGHVCKVSHQKTLVDILFTLWLSEPNYSDRKSMCKQNSPRHRTMCNCLPSSGNDLLLYYKETALSMIPSIFYTNFILFRIAKQHLNLIIILIKITLLFFCFCFFKSIEHLRTTFSVYKKKRIISLTIAIYISVMQHLAPL